MVMTAQSKTQIIGDFSRADKDSGSPEVQVALLTTKIRYMTEHMKTHKHDYASRRGLGMMVAKRNRHLRYLARQDRLGYQKLIGRLGLRK